MSHSANRSWSQSAGVRGAEEYKKCCRAMLLQIAAKERKVEVPKHYFGEGAVRYSCIVAVWKALECIDSEKREWTVIN